ncbi:MAG: DUF4159 domain-containing protein, partial [Akkermansiaceae bacterium]|nr:DUF4159 domain-containing protein [Verrucomicrobiales bacterium]
MKNPCDLPGPIEGSEPQPALDARDSVLECGGPPPLLKRKSARGFRTCLVAVLILSLLGGIVFAQRMRGGRGRGGGGNSTEGGYYVDVNRVKTAREVASHSTDTPNWTNNPAFARDTFTFVRLVYGQKNSGRRSGGNWITDFPDSDLNLSFRLQQMTSIKVDPNGRIMRINDPDLFNYPWVYMVEPGNLEFTEEEVPLLRKYLLSGGFLMADDFWGEMQWFNFQEEMKRVFPDRQFIDLPMEHPIFHCVFDLKGKKNSLQIPAKAWAMRVQFGAPTWEYHDDEECSEVHVRAMQDEKGRIMVVAFHNTDNGDGWEREGEDDFFFHRFSENIAFPLGINVI